MHYTMTITADHDMDEAEALRVFDLLGEYDCASVGARKIDGDGAAGPSLNDAVAALDRKGYVIEANRFGDLHSD